MTARTTTPDTSQQVVLVTGGSRGLGQGMVESLLADGHIVATFSRSRSEFIDACYAKHGEDGPFTWAALDATDHDGVKRFVMDLARKHGRIDALINNAGVAETALLPMLRPDQIQRVLSINLEACIMIAQSVSRVMLAHGGGRIINVSSIVGSRGFTGLSVYSATKAALDGLTRSLARELGSRGILVNSLAPGFIETDMSNEMAPARRKQVIRRTPLGRLGNIDDVTGVVKFMLSPASAYMTGQTLIVDGGSTC